MTAYVISEVEALDAELFEKYRTIAASSIARYGVATWYEALSRKLQKDNLHRVR